MRYMNLEGHNYEDIANVGGYRHNYEGFYKRIHIPNVCKSGENDHNSRCLCKPFGNYLLSFLSLLVNIFEEDI